MFCDFSKEIVTINSLFSFLLVVRKHFSCLASNGAAGTEWGLSWGFKSAYPVSIWTGLCSDCEFYAWVKSAFTMRFAITSLSQINLISY